MFKYLLKHLSAVSVCLIEWPGCRASDKCQREKRKTVNGDDLLWAMATLGFEDYIEPLKSYLSRYREVLLNLWLHESLLAYMPMIALCTITVFN